MEFNKNSNNQLNVEQPPNEQPRSQNKYPLKQIGLGLLIVLLIVNTVLSVILLSKAIEKPEFLQTQLGQILQKQTSLSEKITSANIQEKYQAIINQLAELNQKKFKDEEIKAKIEKLSEEIYNLRVLNPYYRFKEIKASFFPTGVPDVYGQELNISFDQVQDAINKVAPLDPTYGQQKITLTGQDLERYIKIGLQISCQYCCAAKTLVSENGEAACGCDHSQMMRGLSAYLIKNHPEISDEQILKELNFWKRTYFPKQTLSVKLQELEKAGEPGIKELLEEFPEFLPQMVGGC